MFSILMSSGWYDSAGMQWHSADERQFRAIAVHSYQSSEWLEQLLRTSAPSWLGVRRHPAVRRKLPADCDRSTWSQAQFDRDQHGPVRHPQAWSWRRSVRNSIVLSSSIAEYNIECCKYCLASSRHQLKIFVPSTLLCFNCGHQKYKLFKKPHISCTQANFFSERKPYCKCMELSPRHCWF